MSILNQNIIPLLLILEIYEDMVVLACSSGLTNGIMSTFLSYSVVVLAMVSETWYDLNDVICFLETTGGSASLYVPALTTRFKRYKVQTSKTIFCQS